MINMTKPGRALRLSPDQRDALCADQAAKWNCDVAAIHAVAEVESAGQPFLIGDGRPTILFERHKFHQFTGGRYSATHPGISNPVPGGYGPGGYGAPGTHQYNRLISAYALCHDTGFPCSAALKSASWGRFQIMGFNHELAGWVGLDEFVEAMFDTEEFHYKAFFNFVENNGLDRFLRERNWDEFARHYNGVDYAKNRYAQRMADAHRKFQAVDSVVAAEATDWASLPADEIRRIQRMLNLIGSVPVDVDGIWGPKTGGALDQAVFRGVTALLS